MKRVKVLLAMAAILAIPAFYGCDKNDDQPAAETYRANCNGANEVPSNGSTATATFTGTYNSSTRTFTGTMSYSGITPTSWYIETGTPTAHGSVVLSLGAIVSSPLSINFTVDAAAEAQLRAGNYYVNITSAGYPSGEIRGQITAQ